MILRGVDFSPYNLSKNPLSIEQGAESPLFSCSGLIPLHPAIFLPWQMELIKIKCWAFKRFHLPSILV